MADYGQAGPEKFATSNIDAGKLVVPAGQGPYPLIVATHGFSASADNQVGWGEHLASHGYVVVVPSLPNSLSPDPPKNADIIAGLAKTYGDPSTASPAKGKADGTRVGLLGHSAGGLASTLASAKMKPRATVLFDPVDRDDLGKAAMPSLCGAVLEIFAEPGSCNANANWIPFKSASVGPLVLFNVVGSTHCDGENNARGLCGPFCGGAADGKRQSIYARYATAFFAAHLKDDAAARTMLATLSDPLLKDTLVRDAPSCALPNPPPPEDAGTTQPDAGSPAPSPSPQPPRDAGRGSSGSPSNVESEPPTAAEAGCACDAGPSKDTPWALLVAGAGALLIRSRRRR
jgi:MYXO-CTERM domain-containing protein